MIKKTFDTICTLFCFLFWPGFGDVSFDKYIGLGRYDDSNSEQSSWYNLPEQLSVVMLWSYSKLALGLYPGNVNGDVNTLDVLGYFWGTWRKIMPETFFGRFYVLELYIRQGKLRD